MTDFDDLESEIDLDDLDDVEVDVDADLDTDTDADDLAVIADLGDGQTLDMPDPLGEEGDVEPVTFGYGGYATDMETPYTHDPVESDPAGNLRNARTGEPLDKYTSGDVQKKPGA